MIKKKVVNSRMMAPYNGKGTIDSFLPCARRIGCRVTERTQTDSERTSIDRSIY